MTLRAVAFPSIAQLHDDDVVSVHVVARWLGCSERTVMRSPLPRVRLTARVVRFRVGDVKVWLREHVRGAA